MARASFIIALTMSGLGVVLSVILAVTAALPAPDPVLMKLDSPRFQYVQDAAGAPHLVDLWVKTSDLQQAARFDPDRQNVYHLFTRQNPQLSQPLVFGNAGLLSQTNFNPQRKTVVLVHGWLDNVSAPFNSVLVPAYLAAEDVNVIVVDWSAGAATINYAAAVANTVPGGESAARFLSWLSGASGASLGNFHFIGHSLGGHQVGIIGRNLGGQVAYITSLEPLFTGWITNDHKFRETDGLYTEVIHTNAGGMGYLSTLGHCDFYPNGGMGMPGCNSQDCDHARAFHYMAESIMYSGFLGTRCASYITAMTGNCVLWGGLRMGGVVPKPASSGVFYLETNASPPFSQG